MANCLYEDLKDQGDYVLKIFHRDAKDKKKDENSESGGSK